VLSCVSKAGGKVKSREQKLCPWQEMVSSPFTFNPSQNTIIWLKMPYICMATTLGNLWGVQNFPYFLRKPVSSSLEEGSGSPSRQEGGGGFNSINGPRWRPTAVIRNAEDDFKLVSSSLHSLIECYAYHCGNLLCMFCVLQRADDKRATGCRCTLIRNMS
jgi:hypothetical protein